MREQTLCSGKSRVYPVLLLATVGVLATATQPALVGLDERTVTRGLADLRWESQDVLSRAAESDLSGQTQQHLDAIGATLHAGYEDWQTYLADRVPELGRWGLAQLNWAKDRLAH
jgi:hypothetical protein